MAIHTNKSYWLAIALLPLAAMAGCCCQIIVPVPNNQFGPNAESRGTGPTYSRDGCQCNGCAGTPYVDHELCGDEATGACVPEFRAEQLAAPGQSARSNPVRSRSGRAENRLPSIKSELAPTESAVAKMVPMSPSSSQSRPAAALALQQNLTPLSSPATKTESRNPSVIRASAESTILPTLTLAPPANAPGLRSGDSQAISLADASLKQPNALPAIDDARPISRKETPFKCQPPKYIPNAIAATALVTAEKRVVEAPSAAAHLEKNPSMSTRVAEHLRNNLQL